jgi:hypothetical protein
LNPIRAKTCHDPAAYRWSSYRHFLNPAGAPAWLDWRTVLAEFAGTEAAARIAYRRFVEAGVARPPDNPLRIAVDGWMLGGPAFVERMRALVQTDNDGPGAPTTLEELIEVTCRTFRLSAEQLGRRGVHDNAAREGLLLLAREVLGEPLSVLSERFGVGNSTISEAVRRARRRCESDPAFQRQIEQLKQGLES